jgi:hypothetical protein
MTAKFIYSILIPLVFLISNCSQNPGSEITGITTGAPAPTPPPQTANTVRKVEKKRIEISAASLKNAKERIAKVVFHSNLLWTLGQNGVLLQTDLAKKRAAPFEYADYVADVYIDDKNELYLLTGDNADASVWRILKKDGDGWSEASALKIDREQKKKDEDAREIVGLTEYANRFLVLSKTKIYLQEKGDDWKTVKLQTKGNLGLQTPFAATDDGFLYVGLNHGEFGGGLQQINLKDGRVENVEKKTAGNICFRPLDSQCDPVTAVVKDAENSDTVFAAVGLRHFSEQGRIVRVSGGSVDVVFNKTYKFDEKSRKVVPENPCDGENEPNNLDNFESEGVFGMQKGAGDGVWLVTGRAIYKLAGGKIAHCSPLPQKFENVDSIAVNESVSGVILIGTDINWAKSLSGTTPLVAVKH